MDKQMKKIEEMTNNERLLRSIIIDLRNELIGGWENAYLDDTNYPKNYTKEDAVNDLYHSIMDGDTKYVRSSMRNLAIERKHLRFMGSKFIRELIEDRVEADYRKNGWAFPNNYEGTSK